MTQLRPNEVFRKFKFWKTDFKCRNGARRENSRLHQVDPRVDWGVDTHGGVSTVVSTPLSTQVARPVWLGALFWLLGCVWWLVTRSDGSKLS